MEDQSIGAVFIIAVLAFVGFVQTNPKENTERISPERNTTKEVIKCTT